MRGIWADQVVSRVGVLLEACTLGSIYLANAGGDVVEGRKDERMHSVGHVIMARGGKGQSRRRAEVCFIRFSLLRKRIEIDGQTHR